MALQVVGQSLQGPRSICDVAQGARRLVAHARIALHRSVHRAQRGLGGGAGVLHGGGEGLDLYVDLRERSPRLHEEPLHLGESGVGAGSEPVDLGVDALQYDLSFLEGGVGRLQGAAGGNDGRSELGGRDELPRAGHGQGHIAHQLVDLDGPELVEQALEPRLQLLERGGHGRDLPYRRIETDELYRRAREEIQVDEELTSEQALRLELGAQAALDQCLHGAHVRPDLGLLREEGRVDVDVHADLFRAREEPDSGDGADLDASDLHGCAHVEAADVAPEEHDEGQLLLEELQPAQGDEPEHGEGDGAQHEGADGGGIRPLAHVRPAAARPADPAPADSWPPRVRKARIFGSFDSARRVFGLPWVSMVRVSASRYTESSPMAKMLASSWVTATTVQSRLSRRERMRSSRSRELTGSRPAEGSSRNRMSGSRAMARAGPARFCIPPLISEG